MAYVSIVISGNIATGTTTTGKKLAEKLDFKFYSAGEFFREYTLKNNIPLYDKTKIPDELDKKVDFELTKESEKGKIVIDAHYLGYFTRNNPKVLKVLLVCEYKVRVQRAINRRNSHQETEGEILKREEEMDKKFRKLYSNEDYLNPSFFDLVIDTTDTAVEEVVSRIMGMWDSGEKN